MRYAYFRNKDSIRQTYKEIYLILFDVLASTTYSGSSSSSKGASTKLLLPEPLERSAPLAGT